MASGVLERLVVALGFEVDKGSTRNALQAYTDVKNGAQDLTAALGGLLVAGAGFAITIAEQNAALLDLAKSLNLTTEEYTKLAYAADMSGISQEALRIGLSTLQRQLGAAGAGSKESANLFNELGVAFENADGTLRTAGEVIPALAEGFQNLGSEGDKTTALMKLFGEQGAKFKELFKDGASGIRELTNEAERFGAVLSSDAAESSAQLDDSIVRLKTSASGIAKVFANELIPKITPLVEQLTEFLADSDGIVKTGLDRFVRVLGAGFDFLATDAGKAAAAIGLVATGLSASRNADNVLGLLGQAGPAGVALQGLAKSFGDAAKSAARFAIPLAIVALILEDFYVTAEGGDSATRRLADALGVGDETVRTFAATLRVLTASGKLFLNILKELKDSLMQMIDLVGGGLEKAFSSLGDTLDNVGSKLGINVAGLTGLLRTNLPSGRDVAGFLPNLMEGHAGRFEAAAAYTAGGDTPGYQFNDNAAALIGPLGAVIQNAHQRNRPAYMGSQSGDISVPITVNVMGNRREDVERAIVNAAREQMNSIEDLQ